MTVTVRFAPSPTGRLHVGNVRTALFNYLYARKHDGKFILRLDDTDTERSTEAFAQGIRDDLGWLGLTHDDTFKQSDRFERYDGVAQALKDRGLLYACYETPDELDRKRKLQRAAGKPPVYDRAALNLTDDQKAAYEAEGRKPHWRYKLSGNKAEWTDLVRGDVSIDTASLSDPILIREDGSYLYTLPSVVDDVDYKVTHIIRGEDHVTNSGAQIEIFEAVGGAAPVFGHTSLLVGADGQSLSKRLGSLGIADLREEGLEPMAVVSLLSKLGTSDPVDAHMAMDTIIGEFSMDKLGRAPARFDPEELRALNAKILHDLPYAAVKDRLEALGVAGDEGFWEAVRPNLARVEEAAEWWTMIQGPVMPIIEDQDHIARAAALLPAGPFDDGTWGAWTQAVKEATGAKGKALFMPLRMALTGQRHGPEMQKLLYLIGPERAQARLRGEQA